jgi:hypothetical protein
MDCLRNTPGLSPTTSVPLKLKVPVVHDAESLSKMIVPFSEVESRPT